MAGVLAIVAGNIRLDAASPAAGLAFAAAVLIFTTSFQGRATDTRVMASANESSCPGVHNDRWSPGVLTSLRAATLDQIAVTTRPRIGEIKDEVTRAHPAADEFEVVLRCEF